MSMLEFYKIVEELNPNIRSRVVTVIDGAAIGEKALISQERIVWLSDPDGFLAARPEALLASAEAGITVLDGSRIYSEVLGSTKKLVICGGGHVSMPVIRMGKMIGMHVTVLEDRLQFAQNAKREEADEVICDSYESALEKIPGDADTYFVIVTRGHSFDTECLRAIAPKPHAYIGMIGSRRRTAIVKEGLKAEGIDAGVLDSVYTPIGLSIGAKTPEEIAVAIIAEIISVKNGRQQTGGYPKEILRGILEEDETHRMPEGQEPRADAAGRILATIVTRKGSAPREAGAKMLIRSDGSFVGTIGGGCVEADVITRARQLLLSDEQSELIPVDMTADAAEEEGMVCGGTVEVLLERI